MRLTHRVAQRELPPVVLTPEYQAEVDRATRRGERAYAKAARALECAENKLRDATRRQDKSAIRVAAHLAEIRRQELAALAASMQAVPASATHRGRRSFRPVPPVSGGI